MPLYWRSARKRATRWGVAFLLAFCWSEWERGGAEILAEYKRGRGSEWGRSFFVRFLFGFTGVAIMGATKKNKKSL